MKRLYNRNIVKTRTEIVYSILRSYQIKGVVDDADLDALDMSLESIEDLRGTPEHTALINAITITLSKM